VRKNKDNFFEGIKSSIQKQKQHKNILLICYVHILKESLTKVCCYHELENAIILTIFILKKNFL
jgi:hypothetical protein